MPKGAPLRYGCAAFARALSPLTTEPRPFMIALADIIDRITVFVGKTLACLMVPLLLLVFANAVLRYVLVLGHVWLFESVGYCFAILAVGLVGWTMKEN